FLIGLVFIRVSIAFYHDSVTSFCVTLSIRLVGHLFYNALTISDRSFRQVGIDTVATVGFSTGWVASRIFGLNLGVNIAVLGQFGTRNVYVPGLAVGINGGRVVLTVHGHSHRVASLDIFTHGTGDGHVGFGLSLVDHIITGNGVNRVPARRSSDLDTVATVGFSAGWITSSIFGL